MESTRLLERNVCVCVCLFILNNLIGKIHLRERTRTRTVISCLTRHRAHA